MIKRREFLRVLILITLVSNAYMLNTDSSNQNNQTSIQTNAISFDPVEIDRLPFTTYGRMTWNGTHMLFMNSGQFGTINTLDPNTGSLTLEKYTSKTILDFQFSYDGLHYWAIEHTPRQIILYDLENETTLNSFPQPWTSAVRLGYTPNAILVFDNVVNTLYFMNKTDGTILKSLPNFPQPQHLTYHDGYVWSSSNTYLYKHHPDTMEVLNTIRFEISSGIYASFTTFEFIGNSLYVWSDPQDTFLHLDITDIPDFKFDPDQDTNSDSNNPDTVYGSENMMWINSNQRTGYLRYPIPNAAMIQSAYIRAYIADWSPDIDTTYFIQGLDYDAWSETTLTYNNRPINDNAPVVDSIYAGVANESSYVYFNVTSYVVQQVDSWVSFTITSDKTQSWGIHTKETNSLGTKLLINGKSHILPDELSYGPVTSTETVTQTETTTQTETQSTTLTETTTSTETVANTTYYSTESTTEISLTTEVIHSISSFGFTETTTITNESSFPIFGFLLGLSIVMIIQKRRKQR